MAMGKTLRSVRMDDGDGQTREQRQREGAATWRADRNERRGRTDRDAKRIERAERHAIRHEDDAGMFDRVLGSDAAYAVGRFSEFGPAGYRSTSMPDAPLRATRAEAEADEAAWQEEREAVAREARELAALGFLS